MKTFTIKSTHPAFVFVNGSITTDDQAIVEISIEPNFPERGSFKALGPPDTLTAAGLLMPEMIPQGRKRTNYGKHWDVKCMGENIGVWYR